MSLHRYRSISLQRYAVNPFTHRAHHDPRHLLWMSQLAVQLQALRRGETSDNRENMSFSSAICYKELGASISTRLGSTIWNSGTLSDSKRGPAPSESKASDSFSIAPKLECSSRRTSVSLISHIGEAAQARGVYLTGQTEFARRCAHSDTVRDER